jgi:hypothetical protein
MIDNFAWISEKAEALCEAIAASVCAGMICSVLPIPFWASISIWAGLSILAVTVALSPFHLIHRLFEVIPKEEIEAIGASVAREMALLIHDELDHQRLPDGIIFFYRIGERRVIARLTGLPARISDDRGLALQDLASSKISKRLEAYSKLRRSITRQRFDEENPKEMKVFHTAVIQPSNHEIFKHQVAKKSAAEGQEDNE